MNKKNITTLLLLITINLNLVAQNSSLFIGGIAHLGNGEKISNSVISVVDGKFDIVADLSKIRIDPEAFDTIYKIYGKHIYPSFIVPNTTLGITEIGQVKATHDFDETGKINPNIRSIIAYNPQSKIVETVITNGVLLAQVTPNGGLISGQSSVMYLNGWNWEDAVCREDDGIHLQWPSSYYNTGWWAEQGDTKKNKTYKKTIKEIHRLFEKALAYSNESNVMDLKMESMKGLFKGAKTLYVHANYASDISDAIDVCKLYKIKKIVLVGAEDALKVSDKIKENNISIILNRIHRLPKNEDENIYAPFSQAKKLSELGILYCLSYEGDMEAMGARNLPFTAGTTVAYGLDYELAVQSISLNAAKILGVDNKIGSIEINKEATFFISDGDALDIRSNNVTHIFIKGNSISTDNHQKRLFNKYRKNK
jgi:imidazolonepropionase-like amidohydrolase